MKKILVTGANGFVGKVTCAELSARGFHVTAAVRDATVNDVGSQSLKIDTISVGNIDGRTNWATALADCSSVIHLAARAHILKDSAADPMTAFRQTNVSGSVQLARSAVFAGVKRFVYVSSVGVNGNTNTRPFTERDMPLPFEAYAESKLEAEQALIQETMNTGMELVIVRPPLVYGPECPGNFLRLLKLLSSGIPLPFATIDSKRSFVSVWNLADFLATCVVNKQAAGEVFLVSDMDDVTLPDLLRGLANGMGKRAPLFSINPTVLRAAAGVVGRGEMFEKLCGNLTVNASHARTILCWTPPVSLAEGLRRTGRWYAER